MREAVSKSDREDLLRGIRDEFGRWPELERRIFFSARYRGQSPEAISRALKMAPAEVSAALRACDRRLHRSLRRRP
ncbi:MAG: hypothetical protein GXY47_07175 [Acidobacteria bacterium]|mgnify:CR=1 FL=1|nr:hypothetical protein [Acidobacteriota bacterium]